jgi:hypothetical protein
MFALMCDIFIMCFVLSEILSFFVFWGEFQRYVGGGCGGRGRGWWRRLLLLQLWGKCVWVLLLLLLQEE